jgi:hypothetical protein
VPAAQRIHQVSSLYRGTGAGLGVFTPESHAVGQRPFLMPCRGLDRGGAWGRGGCSAFAAAAVGVAVFLPGDLGAVPDQETGVAGELIVRLGDHLDDQFLGREVGPGSSTPSTVSASSISRTTLRTSGVLADFRAWREALGDSATSGRTSS